MKTARFHFEGSMHKGSKTNYFRFGHFYTTRKISTSPTRWRYPFCDWPIHFRAMNSAKKVLNDEVSNVACTKELRNSASTMVLNQYELERLLRNSWSSIEKLHAQRFLTVIRTFVRDKLQTTWDNSRTYWKLRTFVRVCFRLLSKTKLFLID